MLRSKATDIVRRLQDAGHEAVFAGGCVRDRILGISPKDYDIATSATPDEVDALFERTLAVGRKFGIQIVQLDGDSFEVATFRKDGPYIDGRRPESVEFTSALEDSARRDFTINALFEDPISDATIDHHHGRADLEAGIIRTVGDPDARFAEDRLRMLRAVRFAARFDFTIEVATAAAIRGASASIAEVSAERVADELIKILTQGNVRTAFGLMDETGLLAQLLPEITAMKGTEQSPEYHPEGDVFVHTMLCLHQLPMGCSPTLALGVLFHDVAKPPTAELRGDKHTFYGHTGMGADMAEEVCRRLRMSNSVIERVRFLVEQHLRHTDAQGMKASTLKRFLRQDGIEELLELTRIDALSSNGDLGHYEYCRKQLDELPEEIVRPPRLVTGKDLIEMGMVPGPRFKGILFEVEDAQLEGRLTTREEALAYLRDKYPIAPGERG
jgi:poly(A) polymerase